MFIQYDPRYQTFEGWGALICEQYATQNLTAPDANTDWRTWGQGLKAIDIFTNEAIPDTNTYSNWQDWAAALLVAINSK